MSGLKIPKKDKELKSDKPQDLAYDSDSYTFKFLPNSANETEGYVKLKAPTADELREVKIPHPLNYASYFFAYTYSDGILVPYTPPAADLFLPDNILIDNKFLYISHSFFDFGEGYEDVEFYFLIGTENIEEPLR